MSQGLDSFTDSVEEAQSLEPMEEMLGQELVRGVIVQDRSVGCTEMVHPIHTCIPHVRRDRSGHQSIADFHNINARMAQRTDILFQAGVETADATVNE
jgi:hypothetical protein